MSNPFLDRMKDTIREENKNLQQVETDNNMNPILKIHSKPRGSNCSLYLSNEAQNILEDYAKKTIIPKSKIIDALILEYLK